MHILLQMTKRALLSVIALMAFCASPALSNQPSDQSIDQPHITATIEASIDPAPSQTFIIAINLTIAEGWHTYWPGINDTGYGVSLSFDPVPGLTFGDPIFPTPMRYLAPGNILDHIYENEMTIFVPVEADGSIKPKDQLAINTTIDYLVCKDFCIPESIQVFKELVVHEYDLINDFVPDFHTELYSLNGFPAVYNDENYTPFESNQQTVIDGEVIEYIVCGRNFAERYWQDNEVTLNFMGATHYTFFPDNNCTQPADLITQGDTESHTLTITFDRSYEDDTTTPARLSGRLLVKFKSNWQEFDIDYTQPQMQENTP